MKPATASRSGPECLSFRRDSAGTAGIAIAIDLAERERERERSWRRAGRDRVCRRKSATATANVCRCQSSSHNTASPANSPWGGGGSVSGRRDTNPRRASSALADVRACVRAYVVGPIFCQGRVWRSLDTHIPRAAQIGFEVYRAEILRGLRPTPPSPPSPRGRG